MWTPEDRALVGDYGSGQALSDDQYRLLEPFIPAAKPGGRPRTTDLRRLLDGLFYLVRTGCQWRHLPPPPVFPPWPTVYSYMRSFLSGGIWENMRHHCGFQRCRPGIPNVIRAPFQSDAAHHSNLMALRVVSSRRSVLSCHSGGVWVKRHGAACASSHGRSRAAARHRREQKGRDRRWLRAPRPWSCHAGCRAAP